MLTISEKFFEDGGNAMRIKNPRGRTGADHNRHLPLISVGNTTTQRDAGYLPASNSERSFAVLRPGIL